MAQVFSGHTLVRCCLEDAVLTCEVAVSDGVLTLEETRAIQASLHEALLAALVDEEAAQLRTQLDRIPLSAPNKPLKSRIREVAALVEDWDKRKATLVRRGSQLGQEAA